MVTLVSRGQTAILINTSGQLGGVKNDLYNGTTPDPLFSTGAYTESDKRPVEKNESRYTTGTFPW